MTKTRLYEHAKAIISKKIIELKQVKVEIQKSANEESKSSAGDKYETGRAMAHLEIEKLESQLLVWRKIESDLSGLDPNHTSNLVKKGSLVNTSIGQFAIIGNIGEIKLDSESYFCISSQAPLYIALEGKKLGDFTQINGKTFEILAVS